MNNSIFFKKMSALPAMNRSGQSRMREVWLIIASSLDEMKGLLLFFIVFQFLGKVEAIQLENNALDKLTEKNSKYIGFQYKLM